MSGVSNDALIRDRALRLIAYLKHIAELRTVPVRDLAKYEHVLWLHEIPADKACSTRAWRDSERDAEDSWISVQKCPEPKPPPPPKSCDAWVDRRTYGNSESQPVLHPQIVAAAADGAGHLEFLSKHPEVTHAWNNHLQSLWKPWASRHQIWTAVNRIYSKLFQIHQTQERLGEQYELVLGLGLLQWVTPQGHTLKRHLITARAALQFEVERGVFTVMAAPDGAHLKPELDMLPDDRPSGLETMAETRLNEAGEDPWDREVLPACLKEMVHLISARGEFLQDGRKPLERAETNPRVLYAPALILRKRSTKGLLSTLQRLQDQIQNGGEIPSIFAGLCERLEDEPALREHPVNGENGTIYFPLPTNEEQHRIIERLNYATGVLVQGPPGTGKSHTIANLICHLLATGKRVLVTAQTPRALKVLQEKLPKQIQPLCVSLLGSGLEERQAMEISVQGILQRLADRDRTDYQGKINGIERELKKWNEEKAEVELRLREIREAEAFTHVIADGSYSGTATGIALRLIEEESEFGWIADPIDPTTPLPLPPDVFAKLFKHLRSMSPAREADLELKVPDPAKDLPDPKALDELVRARCSAEERLIGLEPLLSTREAQCLERAPSQNLSALVAELELFYQALQSIREIPLAWVSTAADQVIAGKTATWAELYNRTNEMLHSIRGLIKDAERDEPAFLERRMHPKSLRHDNNLLQSARDLGRHFKNGGGTGWLWFKPRVVTQNSYLLTAVTINGQPCDNAVTLERLVRHLTVKKTIAQAWTLWQGQAECTAVSFSMQIAELDAQLNGLKAVLQLEPAVQKARNVAKERVALVDMSWNSPNTILKLLDSCRAVEAKRGLARIQKQLEGWVDRIKPLACHEKAHPLASQFLQAIIREDVPEFRNLLDKLHDFRESAHKAKEIKAQIAHLSSLAPNLVGEIQKSLHEELWENRLNFIESAWNHARTRSWLRVFRPSHDQQALEERLRQLERKLGIGIGELASLKAWHVCLSRMNSEVRGHLVGWQQAMSKLGKGTGKYASKHRRDAQEHLNHCRKAVPAWIMPLHRVFDTIEPSPGCFDVVIVDEASQCGQESLPLLYLGKKILVVGDDQQISPDNVGVDRATVHAFAREFLHDFKHMDAFDIDGSLFDHGGRRFGSRIVLREHFRCMPEIIRFSNNLCYSGSPLIPLRQFSPSRLMPLQHRHIACGFREGKSDAINRPEAEALAEQVVLCCRDPRYKGQTMGVISLQGDAQAQYIENLLIEKLGTEDMLRRRIVCGNAYSFQGDERDVIFLSLVAAPNETIGALSKASDKRRFNVAASRARDQMWLFHTATRNDLSETDIRRELVEFFENPMSQITKGLGQEAEQLRALAKKANRSVVSPPEPFESWFELDIALEITGRGYRVLPQYHVAEKRIDLVIEGQFSRLAVECDGDHWHGIDAYESDSRRQRILERAGWRFWRIRASAFYANRETALASLWEELDALAIRPVGKEQDAAFEFEHPSNSGSGGPKTPETQETFDAGIDVVPNEIRTNHKRVEGEIPELSSEVQNIIAAGVDQASGNSQESWDTSVTPEGLLPEGFRTHLPTSRPKIQPNAGLIAHPTITQQTIPLGHARQSNSQNMPPIQGVAGKGRTAQTGHLFGTYRNLGPADDSIIKELKRAGFSGGVVVIHSGAKGFSLQRSGVRAKDVIVEIEDGPVKDKYSFQETVRAFEPGKNVSVKLWRDGKVLSVVAVVE